MSSAVVVLHQNKALLKSDDIDHNSVIKSSNFHTITYPQFMTETAFNF